MNDTYTPIDTVQADVTAAPAEWDNQQPATDTAVKAEADTAPLASIDTEEKLPFDAPVDEAPAPPPPPAGQMITHAQWHGFSGAPIEAYSAFPRWLAKHGYGEEKRTDVEWGTVFTTYMNSVPDPD